MKMQNDTQITKSQKKLHKYYRKALSLKKIKASICKKLRSGLSLLGGKTGENGSCLKSVNSSQESILKRQRCPYVKRQ